LELEKQHEDAKASLELGQEKIRRGQDLIRRGQGDIKEGQDDISKAQFNQRLATTMLQELDNLDDEQIENFDQFKQKITSRVSTAVATWPASR